MRNPPYIPFLSSLCSLRLSNTSFLRLSCLLCVPFRDASKPTWTWTLDKVKKRLRAEQVQRETLAAERYRRQEDQGKEQETKTGQTSCTQSSLLLFLSLSCLLLSLAVLVLSSVVLTQAKK
jgi:hypothetical protein